jgi:formate dehydrogenase major subunit
MSDVWVPLRAGSDIIFLGALVRHVLDEGKEFRDYVVHYTNAATILREDFRDTEDLDGLFSGWNEEKKKYDPESWLYQGAPAKEVGSVPRRRSAGHGQVRIRSVTAAPALCVSGAQAPFLALHTRNG